MLTLAAHPLGCLNGNVASAQTASGFQLTISIIRLSNNNT